MLLPLAGLSDEGKEAACDADKKRRHLNEGKRRERAKRSEWARLPRARNSLFAAFLARAGEAAHGDAAARLAPDSAAHGLPRGAGLAHSEDGYPPIGDGTPTPASEYPSAGSAPAGACHRMAPSA
jgi:hypothetical protein